MGDANCNGRKHQAQFKSNRVATSRQSSSCAWRTGRLADLGLSVRGTRRVRVVGGSTAFPGSAVVIWAGLQHMPKLKQRAIVQPYILFMQACSLLLLTLHPFAPDKSGGFDATFWTLFVLLLPVVLPMTKLGVWAFKRVSDVDFKRITLALLSLSGVGLTVKGGATVLTALASLAVVWR